MINKKEMSLLDWVYLVLGVALLFGMLIRFLPGLQAGFPLNDGGMFLSMIQDLKSNGYALPQVTSYNHLQIPYTYPPFGFYAGGILSDVLRLPELDILRWLPPLVNSFSILAVFLLASELLGSKPLGALASAFYALTPGASSWFIMGGGLTRSFGSLFLLLAVYSVYRLFRDGDKTRLLPSIIFCGLTVLSHPEAGVHTAATCILLWLFMGRSLRSFFHAVIVGAGVLLVTSPWWGTALAYHGFAPFISALNSGSYGTPIWLALTGMILGRESYLPILAVLRVLGLGWGLWKKEYF
ncbi:MAG: glycosyltransferase family 39 protein, partial [Anaerolineales bacterium]|nr:glycosyltransferase family 39 protein [Anaerolineales bacterium]